MSSRPTLDPDARRALNVYRLGRVEYGDGLKMQALFTQWLERGGPDALLLLQHPPVLTLGRAAKREHLLARDEQLEALGVALFETSRGGDVTYHGPGQLVGYPVLQLEGVGRDVRRYVRGLEEVLIRTLRDFGLAAFREPQWPGVWVDRVDGGGRAKIAALGVHISRWRTTHGFALNVEPDLKHFELIVPCGIKEAGVTSMARELGRSPPMMEVEASVERHFARVFEYPRVESTGCASQTVSVVVVGRAADGPRVLCLRRTPEQGGFWQIITGRVEAGERPENAAARELREETGNAGPIHSLNYGHAFAFLERVPPHLVQETAFAAQWQGALEQVALSPNEHDAYAWLSPVEAMARIPFEGLREAVRRATSDLVSRK
ncbi:MAG TPA: lipoyl(octanoyl) transferase LipB [Myxococcaceae bacterium]|nr:lipoyl(octanoyl) transferase LipB [Myxococcaceae bacterium]